jgi:16S rRNA (guanine966-N2)-methyltransferase
VSSGVLDGALVADLFAGTGAVGIEALSRGAEQCTFVERDREALRALDENLRTLGLADRARVVRSDALAVAPALDVDIAIIDPPYEFDGWDRMIGTLRCDRVVAESGREISPPEGWVTQRARRYGRTWVTFLERSGH